MALVPTYHLTSSNCTTMPGNHPCTHVYVDTPMDPLLINDKQTSPAGLQGYTPLSPASAY